MQLSRRTDSTGRSDFGVDDTWMSFITKIIITSFIYPGRHRHIFVYSSSCSWSCDTCISLSHHIMISISYLCRIHHYDQDLVTPGYSFDYQNHHNQPWSLLRGGLINRKTLSIFGDKICKLPLTHLQNVMYSVGKGWANTVAGKLPFCGFMTALDHLTSLDVHHVY